MLAGVMGRSADACGKFLVLDPQLVLDLGLGPTTDDDPVPATVWLPADRDRPGPAIPAPVVVDRIFAPGTVDRPQIHGPALAASVLRLAPIVPGHHYSVVEPRLRGSSVADNGGSPAVLVPAGHPGQRTAVSYREPGQAQERHSTPPGVRLAHQFTGTARRRNWWVRGCPRRVPGA